MTRHKTFLSRCSVLILICLLEPGSSGARLLAADAEPSGGSQSTISIDFKGGSLADYLTMVQKTVGNINIIVPSDAAKMAMPAVSLKQIAPETALRAAAQLFRRESMEIQVCGSQEHNDQVYVIVFQNHNYSQNPGELVVFALKALTGKSSASTTDSALKPEDVIAALNMALGLSGRDDNRTVKYHADSGLLMVFGQRADIEAARQVIYTFERPVQIANQRQQKEIDQLKTEVALLMKAAGK